MGSLHSWCILVGSAVAAAAGPLSAQNAPPQAAHRAIARSDSILYVCSLERATAHAGSEVAARVHMREGDARRVRVSWSATAGVVDSVGHAVRWKLQDVPLGIDTLTARLAGPDGFSALCHLRLAVLPPDAGRGGAAGRSLLVRGHSELPGYGIYSYVLLAPPSRAAAQRHAEIMSAYHSVVPDLRQMERELGRGNVAVVYLPVDRPIRLVTADSLVSRYDYARAQALKSGIPRLRPGSLYLVAVQHPISLSGHRQDAAVAIDVSAVPPRLLSSFVREFVNQLAQEQPGDQSLTRFALRMRAWLAIAADGLPEVRSAVGEWIKFFEDLAGTKDRQEPLR